MKSKFLPLWVFTLLIFSGISHAQDSAKIDSPVKEIKPIRNTDILYKEEEFFVDDNFTHFSLKTPAFTILSHLYFLKPSSYHLDSAAMTLNFRNPRSEQAKNYAKMLGQYFDGSGFFIDPEELPLDPDYIDSASGKHVFFPFPSVKDIYLVKVGSGWHYSSHTTMMIPKLHAKIFPLGTVEWVPGWSKKYFLGLMIWQWAGILLFLIAAIIFHEVFTFLLSYFIKAIARRFSKENIALLVFRKAARPFSLMIITLLLIYFVPTLGLPLSVNRYVMLMLRLLAPTFGVLVFYYLMDVVSAFMMKQAEKTETKLDDNLVPLVRKILKALVIVAGFVLILQNLEVNITALLAGLSIGGLALALAAQDTVKNLFGSLMLYLDRPFQAGDWIISGEIEGMVEEVGMRSTRIRTFNDSMIYIPNGKLADNWINNMELRVYRRLNTTMQIAPETSPEIVELYIENMEKLVLTHLLTKKDEMIIGVHEVNANAIVIRIMVYFSTEDSFKEAKARQQILLAFLKLAGILNIRVSTPGQKLVLENSESNENVKRTIPNLEQAKSNVAEFVEKWKDSFPQGPQN